MEKKCVLKEIELHAQIMLIVLTLIVNRIEKTFNLYDHFIGTTIFRFIVNKIFIRAPKIMRNAVMALIWIH